MILYIISSNCFLGLCGGDSAGKPTVKLKIGAASHLGILLDICTIGVTKGLLCGEVKEGYVYLDNEKAGYELKRKNFRPIYISPGNKISLKTSIKIVKRLNY